MANNRGNKVKTSNKTIKELAQYFDQELQTKLPVTILPNGDLMYKNYLVKQLSNQNWGVFNILNKDLREQYHLKSCALMAAKAYNHRQLDKCSEIKSLDNSYWANHSNVLVYKNIINKIDDDQYPIMLTRLEESDFRANRDKHKISKLFKHTFV